MIELTRRMMLKAVACGAGAAAFGLTAGQPKQKRRIPYVDGLCLLGDGEEQLDFANCEFQAVVLDVSSGEEVTLQDGTRAYRRTFAACQKGMKEGIEAIRGQIPGGFVALKGSAIPFGAIAPSTACILQMQGCDWMEGDLTRLAAFHEQGLRIAQFTHHYGNTLAGGCMDLPQSGLTPFGAAALREMDRLKVIPDLAHASEQTGLDVLKVATRPVIVSHGACRSIVNNARCTSDAVIRGVAERGGVMGLFMMSFWLTNDPNPTVDHLLAQIRHIIQVGGIDAVGISNDYPAGGESTLRKLGNDNAKGIENYLPWWKGMRARGVPGFEITPKHVVIPELNSPRRMFNIHAALERAKFRPTEVEKIMGGNWIRVFKESLG